MKRQKQTLQAKKCVSSILAINITSFLAISILCGQVMASTTNTNASTASTASTTTTQSKSEAIQNAKSNLDRFNANSENFVSFLKNSELVNYNLISKDFFNIVSNKDFSTVTWLYDYQQEESTILNPKSCSTVVNKKTKEKKIFCTQKKGTTARYARPTIYYVPIHVDYYNECVDKKIGFKKVKLANSKGDPILEKDNKTAKSINMCMNYFKMCHIEGSCFYTQKINAKNNDHPFNKTYCLNGSGNPAFELLDSEKFPFGKGLGNAYSDQLEKLYNQDLATKDISLRQAVALDPFYSVAADSSRDDNKDNHYQPGDVLFFPSLVGLLLPDGSRHNGFMVVRDTGAKSIFAYRANRFDFFTGFTPPFHPDNPFNKLELSQEIYGKRNSGLVFPFFKVTGLTKLRVLKWRNFPSVPLVNTSNK